MKQKVIVRPSSLQGEMVVPSSKSQTFRAILFASLAQGESQILNTLHSSDTLRLIDACRQIGAELVMDCDRLVIQGNQGKVADREMNLDVGNSGIIYRFMTALAAHSSFPVHVRGDLSIRFQRPIRPLLNALERLGVETVYDPKQVPHLMVKGPLGDGEKVIIKGTDSQFVSALLISGMLVKRPLTIHVREPREQPWVGLTLHWFDRLGIKYHHDQYKKFQLYGFKPFKGFHYTVPGDLSSAAFPLAAALLTGSDLSLKNVDLSDPQGDKEVFELFTKMGAKIHYESDTLHVKGKQKLKGIEVDVNECIDALPILAVMASCAEGESYFYNAAGARTKECDRIACVAEGLRKMGVELMEYPDGLRIKGGRLRGAHVRSYDDHRIAMAFAVAALVAEGESEIEGIECVEKTYPHFFEELRRLGATVACVEKV